MTRQFDMCSNEKITILGAGIGGLTAALACAQHGAKVQVLEQAEAIREVGAGLQISPNGFKVLDRLGLGSAVRSLAVEASAVQLRDYAAGKPVFSLELAQSLHRPYLFVHRADLINLLAGAARAAGVKIRFLQHVKQVELCADGKPCLTTAQGARVPAGLLIGADGVKSVVRPAVCGPSRPFFTRQVAWRAVVPALGEMAAQVTVHMGPGRHIVSYPIRGGKFVNIVAVEERTNWVEEGWNRKDDPQNVREAFAKFCPDVRALLDRVEEVHLWGLFRHPVANNWSKGRMAVLGDAAHPTLPFMAQGASMAIEDAWALAQSLDTHDDVAKAFAAYQDIRIGRVRRVINASSNNARNYHLSFPPLRFAAHTALRIATRVAPEMALKKFDWLYGYDITKEI
ncbi:FAD-dependent monooxygenase [Cochlodiniinecator piscidefendens]|uniref:FAD-dependent monooxygenase n=1 Tax=Cochlodiniinecator piscidefendens TaxID=2715756 RepID=UPI001E415C8B|nr:FAD-dependent monooxygenase [Cochlodiniinecator piscidefendens]